MRFVLRTVQLTAEVVSFCRRDDEVRKRASCDELAIQFVESGPDFSHKRIQRFPLSNSCSEKRCLSNGKAGFSGPPSIWDVHRSLRSIGECRNLKSMFHSSQAVLPSMIQRGVEKIVNISSVTFQLGTPNLTHYVASKGGVIGLTRPGSGSRPERCSHQLHHSRSNIGRGRESCCNRRTTGEDRK
jgi:hypothetical protein